MEYTHWDEGRNFYSYGTVFVLILVLMEYTHWVQAMKDTKELVKS